ncbi:alkaline phosphatase D family protein [Sphingomonas sp. PL-96]|uniref:alkaline phosphatase D family protein n=1 Tax=Sphingomonas sp. PL-96 TaxID=2887201 RepID=UPI001E503DAB|nr:alkaline phosphatase D family protein [Sphingomonas sp. PL-96]MCC2977099.1 alkaline phosphatase D family protein [Sphingomonas sp. PL-96]
MTLSLTRRALIGGTPLLLAAPSILRAQTLFAAYPFRLGVAAGDPSSDGFVLWTRLASDPLGEHGGMPMAPIEVDWQVATDEAMRTVVAKGTVVARPELAHAVHVEVAGLQPARPYWYRFTVGGERSARGCAKTLPRAGAPLDRVRFAVAGCQHYEDGLYTAYRHLAGEEHDFVFHYGDYIYEGRSSPVAFGYDGRQRRFVRAHDGQMLYDLADYRRRYAQYKLDPDLQAAHAAAAWFATFDDHEVENNWVGVEDQRGTPSEVFALRRAAAFQAWYEHLPVRRSAFPGPGGMLAYRRATIGNLVDLHLLDTRSYRSDQPCDDGFKPVCDGARDADVQVLGAAQEKWLEGNLAQDAARWNAIAQQVMVMPLDRRTGDEPQPIRNMDSWAAYDAPRERLLRRLKGRNAVVLTGDEHQSFAGELRTRGGTGEVVAVEFVTTSITSGGDGADRRAGTDRILANNPFLKFTGDRRGYAICDVTSERWQTQARIVRSVSTPDAPVDTLATFTVPAGEPALSIG